MKDYRNKPNRDKRNRTSKAKSHDIREVPSHVWENIRRSDKRNSPFDMSMAEHQSFA